MVVLIFSSLDIIPACSDHFVTLNGDLLNLYIPLKPVISICFGI